MIMNFNSKTDFITLTLSRQLCMMAKQYKDSINFTLGDPDLSTPQPICDAAYKAISEGRTHYAPNAGIPELRSAICSYVNEKRGTNYVESNILVTVGAVEAIYLSFMALLNAGDEVLVMAPYWSQYLNITKIIGATPIIIDEFSHDFEPSIEAIKKAISPRTKAIVINTPNNPSGYIYSRDFLKQISNLAAKNNLFVFADEVYDTLVYEDNYTSLAEVCPKENLLLYNSCSKAFAMTGWRIGYVLADESFIKTLVKLQQNFAASVPTMTQYGALEAFNHAKTYSQQIFDIFSLRRKCLIECLKSIPSIKYLIPSGTFYAFIDISCSGLDSKSFCFSLLEKKHVALVPGIAYGDKFDNYVRLAFTQSESILRQGVEKIREFIMGE